MVAAWTPASVDDGRRNGPGPTCAFMALNITVSNLLLFPDTLFLVCGLETIISQPKQAGCARSVLSRFHVPLESH